MGKQGDIDLLRREMDLLWGTDLYDRPRWPPPLVALAVATDGHAVRFGPAMPNRLRRPLKEGDLLGREGEGAAPPSLERWREELASRCPTRVHGGPSYVFDRDAAPPSSPRVVTSQDGSASSLSAVRPESWGEPQEWADLLAGRLGPWAVGMAESRVASICYTPVASPTAAEAGVWTLPEERGRGWAAIVTAAWARVAAARFEVLFYSAGFHNAASQAVARKLGVRPIGAIWQILEDVPRP